MTMFDQHREETVPLAGSKDPTGTGVVSQHADRSGASSQINLDAHKRTAVIRYRDKIIEADVYALEGEPVKVVIVCPRCHHVSNIDESRKAIEWRPHAPQLIDGEYVNCGSISIEPFECPWELPDAGVHTAGLVSGGLSLCKLKLGVINNIAKDA